MDDMGGAARLASRTLLALSKLLLAVSLARSDKSASLRNSSTIPLSRALLCSSTRLKFLSTASCCCPCLLRVSWSLSLSLRESDRKSSSLPLLVLNPRTRSASILSSSLLSSPLTRSGIFIRRLGGLGAVAGGEGEESLWILSSCGGDLAALARMGSNLGGLMGGGKVGS